MTYELCLAADMAELRSLLVSSGLVVDDRGSVWRGDWELGWARTNPYETDGELEFGRYSVVFSARWLSDGSVEPLMRHLFERARDAGFPVMLVEDLAEKLDQFEPAPSSPEPQPA